MTSNHTEIRTALLNASHIAIATHVRPDGDAIGSLLGLGLALRAAGKQVTLLTQNQIPPRFYFLAQANTITQTFPKDADFFVALDCASIDRLGPHQNHPVDLNIDHHITNTKFARHNIVPDHAVSTTEILADLIDAWQLPLTPDVANPLLCGLITDTIGFSVQGTTDHTLSIAQRLIAAGADLPLVYRKGHSLQSLAAIRVWGIAFNRIRQEDGILWTSLPKAEKKKAGFNGRGDADVINIIRSIEGADVYIIFVEDSPEETKISWRAEWVDVSQIALQFGGGGHMRAAGANVNMSLEQAQIEILTATRKALAKARKQRDAVTLSTPAAQTTP